MSQFDKKNNALLWGAIFGMSGVILGAFATHALRQRLSAADLEIFKTGTHYQLVHAVALVALAGLEERLNSKLVARLWTMGTLIFSGSLYALAGFGIRWMGAIAPIGGSLLISGWAVLVWLSLRPNKGSD